MCNLGKPRFNIHSARLIFHKNLGRLRCPLEIILVSKFNNAIVKKEVYPYERNRTRIGCGSYAWYDAGLSILFASEQSYREAAEDGADGHFCDEGFAIVFPLSF